MNIRPIFRSVTMENYVIKNDKQSKIVEFLRQYIQHFEEEYGKNLIFLGNPGTGKGHLAISLARTIEEKGFSCEFIKCYELLRQIKNSWKKNAEESEDEVLKRFRKYDLLVIDEVGMQFSSDADKLLFYDVVDYRHEYLRPTIVTANCSLDTLKSTLGGWMVDRLQGNSPILVFDWESYRRI